MVRHKTTTQTLLAIFPGIILATLIMIIGLLGADLTGQLFTYLNIIPSGGSSPISGIFIAIIVGIFIRNIIGIKAFFIDGIQFAIKYMLRFGIVLLGLRLSFSETLKLGAWGLPIIVTCITSGLLITIYFAKKLNISRRLALLIAGGTSICGVTAIMALSPGIKAKDDEVSYAVANITIFGLLSMFLYPYLANFLFAGDPIKVGMFLGTAIHDTAQVTGASLIYGQMYQTEKVVDVATVTKLTRNLFIIVVLPIVTYSFYRANKKQATNTTQIETTQRWYHYIPLFVVGFLATSLLRTIGDSTVEQYGEAFLLLSTTTWTTIYESLSSFGATYLLGIAMAGVGLSTNLKIFSNIGLKPLYVGLISALCVGIVSFILVSILGNFVSL